MSRKWKSLYRWSLRGLSAAGLCAGIWALSLGSSTPSEAFFDSYGTPAVMVKDAAILVVIGTGNPVSDHLAKEMVEPAAWTYESSAIFEIDDFEDYAQYETKFLERLEQELRSKSAVDIIVLRHTNSMDRTLAKVPAELRKKIRLVYNTGCTNAHGGDAYMKLGIGAYIGHPGISCSPVFVSLFKDRWLNGYSLKDAVKLANDDLEADLMHGVLGDICKKATSADSREEAFAATKAQLFGNTSLTIHARYRGSK